jgi:1,4-alpha-glucan branching enzyme
VGDLNKLLKAEPGLHKKQFSIDGFEWVDLDHRAESVIVFKRKGETVADDLLIILNMTQKRTLNLYVLKNITRDFQ